MRLQTLPLCTRRSREQFTADPFYVEPIPVVLCRRFSIVRFCIVWFCIVWFFGTPPAPVAL